jgi:CHAT domain-containing protein
LDVKALNRQILELHRRNRSAAAADDLATILAETLLRPLGGTIDGYNDLIIVPYGAGHILPFHALPWHGEPLAATHTISYLPSASVIQFLATQNAVMHTDQVLAVGNPANMAYTPPLGGPPRPADSLREAATEARLVAELFPEGLALVDEEATQAAVRNCIDYPLLHFATHGYLSEEAPLLSAILLANGEALTVYELMGMRLHADLVVLSACNTAQGETTGGDDVLGLTRGLLAAGARAAVVSLWPVHDLATSLLMCAFYQALKAGEPPRKALQRAQLQLCGLSDARATEGDQSQMRHLGEENGDLQAGDYSHPFYWAPFILVGL